MLRLLRDGRPAIPPARVPEGSRVYAVSDIHGCAHLLARLHELIRADAAGRAERHVVVYVGDYVDRGADSRGVIDLLLDAPLAGFERVHLRGNHDAWMHEFLDDATAGPDWLANGGQATLLSYGVGRATAATTPFGRLAAIQEQFRAALPEAHRRFLAGLRPVHVEGDYLFVHAGVRPGVPLDRQLAEDMLWIRGEFLDSDADHGKVVVHGHTMCRDPEVLPNRIGIDTGAYATGRLTCLVLEGTGRRFLHT